MPACSARFTLRPGTGWVDWPVRLRAIIALLAVCAAMLACGNAQAQDSEAEPPPGRMALVIGNSDYDPDGENRATPGYRPATGRLKDLRNPCRDADLFTQKLLAAGWRPEEIVAPPCNVKTADMRTLVTNFREKLANSTKTLAIFYYAGHGAQFAYGETPAESYLFGVDAKLDLDAAAESLRNSPGNTSFIANSALNLDELVKSAGRLTTNALLVILDACRDNPLYDDLRAMEGRPYILALSANDYHFTGTVVAYSTAGGAYADDGVGDHSIYTKALTSLLVPSWNLNQVLDGIRPRVEILHRREFPHRRSIQEPDTRGRFNGDWCVYACPPRVEPPPLDVAATDPPRPILAAVGGLPRIRTLVQSPADALAGPPRTAVQAITPRVSAPVLQKAAPRQEPPRVVFDPAEGKALALTAPRPTGVQFDVFWCDGGPGADARRAHAGQIADALDREGKKQAAAATPPRPDQAIGVVRALQLSASANAQNGFRYSDDVVIYDAGDSREIAWSRRAAELGRYAITPQADVAKTPGYISIFVCKAPQPDFSTLIYFQAPDERLRAVGSAMMAQLIAAIPTTSKVRDIEVRRDGPRFTELRFYHPEDRDNVFRAAAVMERILQQPVTIKYLSQYTEVTKPGRMEIWLGQDVPVTSTAQLTSKALGVGLPLKQK